MIRFTVPGVPIPKGSASAVVRYAEPYPCSHGRRGKPYAQVFPDNSKTKKWEKAIRAVAGPLADTFTPFDGPVELGIVFLLPRPANHYRANGAIKPWASVLPHVFRPDVDKLVRSCLDALNGIFYADDSQVTGVLASKRYVLEGEDPGVVFEVEQVSIEEPEPESDKQPELALEVR